MRSPSPSRENLAIHEHVFVLSHLDFLSLVAFWLDPDFLDKGFSYYFFIPGKNMFKKNF
jgi:hypothetical protein